MNEKESKTKKYIMIAMVSVVIFGIQFISSRFGWLISQKFDCSSIDKDGLFAQVAIHHIVQALFAILFIIFLGKIMKIDGFKLRPQFDPAGVRYTVIFCIAILIYHLIIYIVGFFFASINTYDYELNAINVLGTLGFQLFLSGPSEEILFRSLPITWLLSCVKAETKKESAIVVVIAAFLFGLGHINFTTFYIPWFQVGYAFVLGLVYGFVFINSNSIIYPMIMHSMSNVISVGGCYVFMELTK